MASGGLGGVVGLWGVAGEGLGGVLKHTLSCAVDGFAIAGVAPEAVTGAVVVGGLCAVWICIRRARIGALLCVDAGR